MERSTPSCLEQMLVLARDDPYALDQLRTIHTDYSEGAVTDGDPLPILKCPLMRCGRERIVEFIDDGVFTADDEGPLPCKQNRLTTSLPYLPPDTSGPGGVAG